MARKSKTGKTINDLDIQKQERFYDALGRISKGTSKKQALIQAKIDPRTFNKELAKREKNVKGEYINVLTPHYKQRARKEKGKPSTIKVAGKFQVNVSTWKVLDSSGEVTNQHVDAYYSSILGQYWNAVENYIKHGNSTYLDNFQHTFILNMKGEKIELMLNKDAIELFWRTKSEQEKRSFDERLYRKEGTNFAA